ncbi:MAG: hypothetical protein WC421_09695 [Elusimicrobiales bacterium]
MRKIIALLLLVCCPCGAAELKTVAHVHTQFSADGDAQPLGKTLELASAAGIDAVVLADDAAACMEYGLPPLRRLLKASVSRKSVTGGGPSAFLEEIAAQRAKFPDIIIIPGVEAAAYYRWSGNIIQGLTVNDWHRHMAVAGMEKAELYRRLPVSGNPGGFPFRVWTLLPLLMVLPAWLLWRRGARKAAVAIALACAVLLAQLWPFRPYPYDIYAGRTPDAPYAALAEYADRNGFLCFWHHPEAPNWRTPARIAPRVSAQTGLYTDCLEIAPYTLGFGAFMEGNKYMTVAGGPWDRALLAFVEGRRPRPAWAFAELDYHRQGKDGTCIDTNYMMVRAENRSPAATLAALKEGKFYPVQPDGGEALRLDNWQASCGGRTAQSGQKLNCGGRHEIAFALSGNAPRAHIRLIRNGTVVFETEAAIPYSHEFHGAAEKSSYYRLAASHRANGALLSNPIFIEGQQ